MLFEFRRIKNPVDGGKLLQKRDANAPSLLECCLVMYCVHNVILNLPASLETRHSTDQARS